MTPSKQVGVPFSLTAGLPGRTAMEPDLPPCADANVGKVVAETIQNESHEDIVGCLGHQIVWTNDTKQTLIITFPTTDGIGTMTPQALPPGATFSYVFVAAQERPEYTYQAVLGEVTLKSPDTGVRVKSPRVRLGHGIVPGG